MCQNNCLGSACQDYSRLVLDRATPALAEPDCLLAAPRPEVPSSLSMDRRQETSRCTAPGPTVEQRAVSVIDPCPAKAWLLLKDSGSVALAQQFAQHDESGCASAHDCLPQMTMTLPPVLGLAHWSRKEATVPFLPRACCCGAVSGVRCCAWRCRPLYRLHFVSPCFPQAGICAANLGLQPSCALSSSHLCPFPRNHTHKRTPHHICPPSVCTLALPYCSTRCVW